MASGAKLISALMASCTRACLSLWNPIFDDRFDDAVDLTKVADKCLVRFVDAVSMRTELCGTVRAPRPRVRRPNEMSDSAVALDRFVDGDIRSNARHPLILSQVVSQTACQSARRVEGTW